MDYEGVIILYEVYCVNFLVINCIFMSFSNFLLCEIEIVSNYYIKVVFRQKIEWEEIFFKGLKRMEGDVWVMKGKFICRRIS